MAMKKTVADIIEMKRAGEKITMLTAYDAGFAQMLEKVGIDMLLVGDSLGMVVLGYESTVPVTMDEMIHHAKAVRRGAGQSIVVGDMPFMSYQVSIPDSIYNAGRFMKEAGCDAVKLEGGFEVCETVKAIVRAGIPVIGHIGLTPQTAGQLGGYKVQGRDLESARKMIADAKALADAGVFSLVLECVPGELAGIVTRSVSVPTIGIGAGPGCDGQVLVIHDMLGLFTGLKPKFVKRYAELGTSAVQAVECYAAEVREGKFPAPEHEYGEKPTGRKNGSGANVSGQSGYLGSIKADED